MNIDDLTVGQLREIKAMACAPKAKTKKAAPKGRAIIVADRGWIFAGDMSITDDGYLRLDNAIHVFKWTSIGFAKMIQEWRSSNVDLRPVDPVELPLDAVLFRIPVADGWGLK